jgi:short subunit dehydrogenase-like uncharacterized protein
MRSHDLVLFGASGFTGKLVAEYLGKHAPSGLKWAIAGRNAARLEAVKRDLGLDVPVLIADGLDEPSLEALVPQARVVCTTVGPYAKYGRALARAAARHGTHYCDLTGEVPFIRASIDENHDKARETGARIVHCCGFDSIPFDLGVHMLWDQAQKAGDRLAWVKGFAGESSGGMSGGTIASMLNLLEEAGRDRGVLRLMADPYALDPVRHKGPDGPDQHGVRFDRDIGRWTGPWVMAAVNTRVVRRSNALLDHAYGDGFRYSEAMSFAKGPKGLAMAAGVTAGLGAFLAAVSSAPVRALLAERVLPKPGEGPSKEARDRGFFKVRLVGETEKNHTRLTGLVEGTSDPGYGETAKMLGESAMCLAQDDASLPARSGVLTPASAMGMRLVERLRAAGMTFSVGTA